MTTATARFDEQADRSDQHRQRPGPPTLEIGEQPDVKDPRGSEHPGEDRQRESGELGAPARRRSRTATARRRDAHEQRRARRAGAERAMRGHPAGAVADRHPADPTGEQVGARRASSPAAPGSHAAAAAPK